MSGDQWWRRRRHHQTHCTSVQTRKRPGTALGYVWHLHQLRRKRILRVLCPGVGLAHACRQAGTCLPPHSLSPSSHGLVSREWQSRASRPESASHWVRTCNSYTRWACATRHCCWGMPTLRGICHLATTHHIHEWAWSSFRRGADEVKERKDSTPRLARRSSSVPAVRGGLASCHGPLFTNSVSGRGSQSSRLIS